jgi:hypothetical protein
MYIDLSAAQPPACCPTFPPNPLNARFPFPIFHGLFLNKASPTHQGVHNNDQRSPARIITSSRKRCLLEMQSSSSSEHSRIYFFIWLGSLLVVNLHIGTRAEEGQPWLERV